MEPYCPTLALYPPMGVELNALLLDKTATLLPIRLRLVRCVQPEKAAELISVHFGNLAVAKELHAINARVLISVHAGNSTSVKDLQSIKALAPTVMAIGKLTDCNNVQ